MKQQWIYKKLGRRKKIVKVAKKKKLGISMKLKL